MFERLSSGQRINRAADDPAGLSVSLGLGSKARVLSRAAQNLSDATSLVTIADSALGAVGGILTRLGELAEQAANGTFSSVQRKTLEAEYNSLDREIRRIGASTTFNGLNLLQGGATARAGRVLAAAEVGADTGQIASISNNGRFVAYYEGNTGDGEYTGYVLDSITGERKVLGTYSFLNSNFRVLDNGDVLQRDDLADTLYFSFATGQSRVVLTTSTSDPNYQAAFSVSADGRYLNFLSTDTFASGSNQGTYDGTARLWQLDLTLGTTTMVGAVSGYQAGAPVVTSADGRYVGFNNSAGTFDVFDTQATGGARRSYASATSGIGAVGVSNSGEAVFSNGVNLFRTSGTSTVTQLTAFSVANSVQGAAISADGTTISFRTNVNILGTNTSGARQIYVLDTTTGQLVMRTNYASNAGTSGILLGSVSSDGSRAFKWSTDGLIAFDASAADSSFDFEAGFGSAGNIIGAFSSFSSALRGLGGGVLSSSFGARLTLDRVRENLDNLAQLRGSLGAVQSRLAIGASLARGQADEITSANSRVRDADIASEAGELTRLSILKQAGASLLAQANQQPALALQLLR